MPCVFPLDFTIGVPEEKDAVGRYKALGTQQLEVFARNRLYSTDMSQAPFAMKHAGENRKLTTYREDNSMLQCMK